ncbi:uncharacterized protein [Clytia hemisphaerica]|uniref:uncharacterized protein n=1 Tax=Clytia hemisphaerica TaxID=252671 RepID=UPI0034D44F7B
MHQRKEMAIGHDSSSTKTKFFQLGKETPEVTMKRKRRPIIVVFVLLALFYWLFLSAYVNLETWQSLTRQLKSVKAKFVYKKVPRSYLSLLKARMKKKQKAKKIVVDRCPHPTLPVKMKSEESNGQDITCKPNRLTASACNYVKSRYHYNYHTYKCGKGEGEPTLNICTFQEQSTTFKCNHKACGAKFNGSIYIQLFDTNRTGWHYTIKPGYNDSQSLERAVLKFAKRSTKFADDFMFLVCQGTNQSQLLHFDATHFKEPKVMINDKDSPKTNNKININVIWLDSVSRRHFFRSLPKTIHQIRQINTNESTKAEVIDFELMQAVHGHTHLNTFPFFEGRVFIIIARPQSRQWIPLAGARSRGCAYKLNALGFKEERDWFQGTVYGGIKERRMIEKNVLPETMSGKQKSNTLPDLNKLFNFMRNSGYKNLYQEDLCYKGFYGLNEMLNGGKTWKQVSKKLKNLQIDDLGMKHFTHFSILYKKSFFDQVR